MWPTCGTPMPHQYHMWPTCGIGWHWCGPPVEIEVGHMWYWCGPHVVLVWPTCGQHVAPLVAPHVAPLLATCGIGVALVWPTCGISVAKCKIFIFCVAYRIQAHWAQSTSLEEVYYT